MKRLRLLGGTVLVISMFWLLGAVVSSPSVSAATLNVVAGTDGIEENSQCQLSEAIQNINNQTTTNVDCAAGDENNDTINLPSGTITLTDNLPELGQSVIINGSGKNISVIDGNEKQYSGISIILYPAPSYVENFELHDLSILHAKKYGIFGQGIKNITLENTMISESESGVVLDNVQNVQISNTEIENNIGYHNDISDIGETAGLFINLKYFEDGQLPYANLQDNSISNNITNTSSDISPAGLYILINCFISYGCDGNNSEINSIRNRVNGNVSYVADEASYSGISIGSAFEQSVANSPPTLLSISETTISDNSAESPSGASFSGLNLYPILPQSNSKLENITISDNTAITISNQVPAVAGAIGYMYGTNKIRATNLTFSNNSSQFPVDSYFPVSGFLFASIDFNTGSIDRALELSNSIFVSNTTNGNIHNCESSVDLGLGPANVLPISLGGNISDDSTCNDAFTDPTDQNNVDPADLHLGTLGDHGGSVPTIPLLEGSIAIDSGVDVAGLTTDARGVTRPQCAAYDSGAYEYNGVCPPEGPATNNNTTPLTYPDPITNSTVSLVLPSDVTNGTVSAISPTTIPKDTFFSFPLGLTSFQFDTTVGATKTITLYYDLPGDPSSYTARKYNTNTKTFSTIQGATITRVTYNNKSQIKLTYDITDGGILDQDSTANGTIKDPVGLAAATVGVPNTGLR